MKKGILLYTGYLGYNHGKYHTPTDDELRQILDVTDEILLITISTYNAYTDKNGEERKIVTLGTVDKMTVDMVGSPERFDIIRSEYRAHIEPRERANYNISEYVSDAVSLAKRLVALNENVSIWYSFPQAEELHALTHLFAEPWSLLADEIKSATPDDIWAKNVKGFYYATEDIISAGYTKFDPSKPENDFDNPIVYSMRVLSEKVHSFGKKLLWIPYYHEAASSSTNMGYVVNLTDIFDTVIIQPSYFFRNERIKELAIVKECVKRQAVVDIHGNIIGGCKRSKTVIGFEMEIDQRFYSDPEYAKRYQGYVDSFSEFLNIYPTAYYAERPDIMLTLLREIKKFYK